MPLELKKKPNIDFWMFFLLFSCKHQILFSRLGSFSFKTNYTLSTYLFDYIVIDYYCQLFVFQSWAFIVFLSCRCCLLLCSKLNFAQKHHMNTLFQCLLYELLIMKSNTIGENVVAINQKSIMYLQQIFKIKFKFTY